MSSNQYVNFALAVVVGVVVAVATWGTGLGLYYGALAFSLTSSVAGAIGGRKKGGLKDAAAGNLEIATATEAAVIPVVFGTARLAGNILRYDSVTFRSVPITQSSGGKGGGKKKQTVGYNYYLVFDYGLCMGPVDAIGQILTSPGEKVGGTGIAFASDTQTVNYSGTDDGGTIKIYRGSATQTRDGSERHAASGDSNYRNVCFAAFGLSNSPISSPPDFRLGQQPAPATYLFEVTRWPVVVDDSLTPVPSFQTKVTSNPADPEWLDANPMAILWEAHTNKIWGQGLSSTLLHTASWVAASQYCFDNKIGMSLVLGEQDDVSTLYETIRSHIALSLFWDGSQIRALIGTDRTNAYATRKLITSEMVVGEPNITRPSWIDTINEVRAQFVDRDGNYQQGIVTQQDLANVNMTGGIRSQKIDFPAFTQRRIADLQAMRVLRDLSTPRGRLQFRLSQFGALLLPADLIEFVWREFNGQDVTTFWRVIEVTDTDQDQQGVEVTCVEDVYATAYIGSGEAFDTSATPIELATARDTSDLYDGDDHITPLDPGLITPICVWEANAWLTGGKRSYFLATEKRTGTLAGVTNYWALDGSSDYYPLGLVAPFAVSGTLQTTLSAGSVDIDRAVTMDITLNDSADESELLSNANKVVLSGDSFESLMDGPYDLLLVDNELILVGNSSEPVPNTYRLSNLWRGVFGTVRAAHSIGATVHYIAQVIWSNHLVKAEAMPLGVNIDLKVFPYSGTDGEGNTGTIINVNPWNGNGAKPFTLDRCEASIAGPNWTVTARPRYHDRGSHIGTSLNADFAALVITLPYEWGIVTQAFNGVTALEDIQIPPTWTFVPDDGTTAAGGLVSFTRAVPVGTTRLEVRQTLNGVYGAAVSV